MLRCTISIAAAALFAFATAGCGSVLPPLTPPERGGPSWTEVTSAHFVLRTDTPVEEAKSLMLEYERLADALGQVIGTKLTGTRLDIVYFARRADFYEIAGHDGTKVGFFTPQPHGDIEPHATVVLYAAKRAQIGRETFVHELAHRLLRERFAVLPPWLNEGFAQYYETLTIVDSRAVVGGVGALGFSKKSEPWISSRDQATAVHLPAVWAPPIEQLVGTDRAQFYRERDGSTGELSPLDKQRKLINYAAARALVQYLYDGATSGDRALFEAFLADIQRGRRARDAFLSAFEGQLARLQEEFRRELTFQLTTQRFVSLRPPPASAPVDARAMSSAEVHLLWARMLPHRDAFLARVNAELDAALALDPKSDETRYIRASSFVQQHRLDEAHREIGAALEAGRVDPRFLYAEVKALLVEKRKPPPELIVRLARVARSAPELGMASLLMDKPEEALELCEHALAADPSCALCHARRSELLLRRDQIEPALKEIDRAITLLPEEMNAAALLALRLKIELRRTVAATPPSHASAPSVPASPSSTQTSPQTSVVDVKPSGFEEEAPVPPR